MEGCNNSGGRVHIKVGTKKYQIRAGVTIMPASISKEAESTASGEMYLTTKAQPARAKLTFSDGHGLRIAELLEQCDVDVTIKLIDVKRTYLFTRAAVVGSPEVNTESGEISGLEIASKRARQIDS